jgi:Yip1 domain
MSDTSVQPIAEGTPGLSQIERVVDAFTAPSKTFTDIKNGHTSWWLPFVLFLVVGTGLWTVVNAKVGWLTVAENQIKMSPKASEAMDKLPAEQRQSQIKLSSTIQRIVWLIAPVGVLMLNLLGALILWPTINFGFGGKATFGKVLAVTWYAGLPGLIKLIIGAIGLFAGVAPDAFVPGNPAGTNFGYFMNPQESNKILFALATAIDPIAIWTMVLIAIGLATVAGVKRSAGYTAVFGWWILSLLIMIGFTAAMG